MSSYNKITVTQFLTYLEKFHKGYSITLLPHDKTRILYNSWYYYFDHNDIFGIKCQRRKFNMKRKESDGKHFDPHTGNPEPIFCPANGWDCPYYENGICYIRDPMEDCNDWKVFWDSWEEWENS